MSASGTGGHASPISPSGDDAAAKQSSPIKRKHDGEGVTQPRAKRNRYISIAWYGITLHIEGEGTSERKKADLLCDSNECKRRKIKCNGETPCQRCGNLSLECVYAPNCCSNGFKDSE
jgi:Fungal Zn(2)-Cys(6) binuclear cluster domain